MSDQPMTPEDAMAAATGRLLSDAIAARARVEAEALDALVEWRRVDRNEWATTEWWAAAGRLRDVADRLMDDRAGIADAIRNAQEVIRDA